MTRRGSAILFAKAGASASKSLTVRVSPGRQTTETLGAVGRASAATTAAFDRTHKTANRDSLERQQKAEKRSQPFDDPANAGAALLR
jgi:hypothetical protein